MRSPSPVLLLAIVLFAIVGLLFCQPSQAGNCHNHAAAIVLQQAVAPVYAAPVVQQYVAPQAVQAVTGCPLALGVQSYSHAAPVVLRFEQQQRRHVAAVQFQQHHAAAPVVLKLEQPRRGFFRGR